MGRTKKVTAKGAEQKRTTYTLAVNVTVEKDGVETLLYRGDPRTYGEGPVVGLKNGLKSEIANNPGCVIDKTSITAFGAEITLMGGGKLYASAIFADAQCPACGAPRNAKHVWCPACQGNIEVDLAAEISALADEF